MLNELFSNNKDWADQMKEKDPEFFSKLANQQSPEYLWIGCSDSRVPANEIVGLLPGELFVHRNVANVVIHTDMNCLSVMQYAIDVLKVKHIIVSGHYGCGGVAAALHPHDHGLIDNWLRNIKDVYQRYSPSLENLPEDEKLARLCELNVLQQVSNTCHTNLVQRAWLRGQDLTIHGWIYGIEDGILKDLNISCSTIEQLPDIYQLHKA